MQLHVYSSLILESAQNAVSLIENNWFGHKHKMH